MFSYYLKESKEIKDLLIEIEALKIVFDQTKILPEVEENIRRRSLLKSSLYSARIEGNSLTLKDLHNLNSTQAQNIEVQNLFSAYNYVYHSNKNRDLDLELIRNLHSQVLKNLSSSAGKFRQEPWGIFNESGFPVYLAPAFFELPRLMEEYVVNVNHLNYHPCINSAIAQFAFEKIHPFADGNGRVGRLISVFMLKKPGFHFRGILPFEEYTDNHRQAYYYALEPSRDVTEFVEYFLQSVAFAARAISSRMASPQSTSPALSLRRQEIFSLVFDHPHCSFDFIARRFPGVNHQTLHYDLKKLQTIGLIIKLGATRGALYRVK